MAEAKPSPAVFCNSRDTFFASPGPLGYNHLLKPDEFTNEQGVLVKNFKANIHYTPEAVTALVARIQKNVIDLLWAKFLEEAEGLDSPKWIRKVKGKIVTEDWPAPSAQEWVDSHLLDPREGSRFSDQFITFTNGAEYKDKKTGETKQKKMRANDAVTGTAVDIEKAKLGMGSLVQPVLTGSIYYAPALAACVDGPAISLKLQGIRIFKLVRWGAGENQGDTTVSDEDMALLGEDVSAEDLSAYTKTREPNLEASKVSPTGEEYAKDDLDDDLPF